MHDILFVEIFEGADEVFHYRPGVALLVQALALDLLEEFTALQVRQEQVDVLGSLVGFVELDDIVVINRAQHIDLGQY